MSGQVLAPPVEEFARQAFRSHLGEPASFEALANGRHHIFRATTDDGSDFAVKIYRPTSTLFKDMEFTAYEKLEGSPFVRRCFAADRARDDLPAYIITDYVEGETLLARVEAGDLGASAERSALSSIVDFVRSCSQMEVSGYGDLDDDLIGDCAAWTEFLDRYLIRVETSVLLLEDTPIRSLMLAGLAAVGRYRRRHRDFLQGRPAAFVPIDMNLANFLIDRAGRLIVLDLKSFLGADPLFALGEWTSHAYGTSRSDTFRHFWGALDAEEEDCFRFYALICNIDVLLYIVNNDAGDPGTVTPWGNPRSFVDLITEHIEAIG